MSRKLVVLPLAGVALLLAAVYLLLYVNLIVNETLYHFGLEYHEFWYQPYSTVFSAVLTLILFASLTMLGVTFLQWKAFKASFKPETFTAEKKLQPALKTEPQKGFKYTLHFSDFSQAAAFEAVLKKHFPHVNVDFVSDYFGAKLVFVVPEEIEDLDKFPEIIRSSVEEIQ